MYLLKCTFVFYWRQIFALDSVVVVIVNVVVVVVVKAHNCLACFEAS